MQYFQGPNTKQILGRSEVSAAAACAVADPELVAASAGATVTGSSAIATAMSILFMTASSRATAFRCPPALYLT